MSLWTAFAITAARSLLLALIAVPVCHGLKSFLRSGPKGRSLAWLLLLLPVLAPRMLTGFGYANFSLSLVPYPVWNELLYAILLLFMIVPVGTIIAYFAPPPPISDEAQHCLQLASPRNTLAGRVTRIRPAKFATAAGLMLVLAFQEFELASLMGVTSWTVWLFDAQSGGLLLSESLRYVTIPMVFELVVLGVVGANVWRSAGFIAQSHDAQFPVGATGKRWAWFYLAASLIVFCCVPWSFVFHAAVAGLPQLTTNFAIGRDIMAGCLFAFLAACVAYGLAAMLVVGMKKRRGGMLGFLVAMGLPGLLGSLVLALSILFVFQTAPLSNFYSTPLPWLASLMLFLLPRALLVLLILTVVRSPEASHLTKLLMRSDRPLHRRQARELQWRSSWALQFIAFVLLFFWAYSDLTSAAILAPPGIVSAPVRLYNLMHYGQSATLSAMVVATFGIPGIIFAAIVLFRRPLQRVLVP